jgi:hypothetical protein
MQGYARRKGEATLNDSPELFFGGLYGPLTTEQAILDLQIDFRWSRFAMAVEEEKAKRHLPNLRREAFDQQMEILLKLHDLQNGAAMCVLMQAAVRETFASVEA